MHDIQENSFEKASIAAQSGIELIAKIQALPPLHSTDSTHSTQSVEFCFNPQMNFKCFLNAPPRIFKNIESNQAFSFFKSVFTRVIQVTSVSDWNFDYLFIHVDHWTRESWDVYSRSLLYHYLLLNNMIYGNFEKCQWLQSSIESMVNTNILALDNPIVDALKHRLTEVGWL